MPFDVIQGHQCWYQSKARTWHPLVPFRVTHCSILDTLRFWATLWRLRATYTVHLRLIRNLVIVDFLFRHKFFFRFVTNHEFDDSEWVSSFLTAHLTHCPSYSGWCCLSVCLTVTDRQTHRRTAFSWLCRALHYMQSHGKSSRDVHSEP